MQISLEDRFAGVKKKNITYFVNNNKTELHGRIDY